PMLLVSINDSRPLHGTEKTATKTAPDRTARSLVLDLETAGRSCGPVISKKSNNTWQA
ncbi:hypothetical protein BDW66DRAFT_124900, partial [Aspergillus desertorum]